MQTTFYQAEELLTLLFLRTLVSSEIHTPKLRLIT